MWRLFYTVRNVIGTLGAVHSLYCPSLVIQMLNTVRSVISVYMGLIITASSSILVLAQGTTSTAHYHVHVSI